MNRGKIKILFNQNKNFKITPKLEKIKKDFNENNVNIQNNVVIKNESNLPVNNSNKDPDFDLRTKLKKLDLTDDMINIILNDDICNKKINPDITDIDELDVLIEGAIKSVGGSNIIKNEGQGNCMFYSLSHHLNISAEQLRQDAVMYISIKWDNFKDFMLNPNTLVPYKNKEEFQNIMLKDGTWGDHTILLALCEMYMVNAIIIVTNKNKLSDPIEINVGSQRTILIKFNSEFHYEAIE